MVVADPRHLIQRHRLAFKLIPEPKVLMASAPVAAIKSRRTDRNKKAGDKQAEREGREKRQHSFQKTLATHQLILPLKTLKIITSKRGFRIRPF